MRPLRPRPQPSALRCVLCRDGLAHPDAFEVLTCRLCGALSHAACALEIRSGSVGCPSRGCWGRLARRRRVKTARRRAQDFVLAAIDTLGLLLLVLVVGSLSFLVMVVGFALSADLVVEHLWR